jgi:hypothetical protein
MLQSYWHAFANRSELPRDEEEHVLEDTLAVEEGVVLLA